MHHPDLRYRRCEAVCVVSADLPAADPLVEAEFELLRFIGIGVFRTRSLDGLAPRWNAEHRALLVGTDLTHEDAEDAVCEVLGLLAPAAA